MRNELNAETPLRKGVFVHSNPFRLIDRIPEDLQAALRNLSQRYVYYLDALEMQASGHPYMSIGEQLETFITLMRFTALDVAEKRQQADQLESALEVLEGISVADFEARIQDLPPAFRGRV